MKEKIKIVPIGVISFVIVSVLLFLFLLRIIQKEVNAAKTNAVTESSVAENNTEVSKVKKPELFPGEKILTISAEEYCKSVGKQLTDYKFVGVQTQDVYHNIPLGTEVVVGYRLEYAGTQFSTYVWQYGTALIPREKTTGN
ncbi:MAG: hypothetical protein Q8N63_05080 [Nanoarchaeota archaeon]|nr:hypothetical protein [Nanoarchaeota archaeon]